MKGMGERKKEQMNLSHGNICISVLGRLRQKGSEFRANQGYTVRPCLKTQKEKLFIIKFKNSSQAVMVHAFNPSTQKQRQADICEFKTSLIYRASFRTARAVTQRNPVSKKTTIK